nr:hypothetical protein CFP56_72577 [Quercus suber]
MSIVCGLPILEGVYCLACARWVWQKCLYTAGHESENWGLATAEEFENVPRLCRLILFGYEEDICNPLWAPPGGYGINPDWVFLRKDYEDTLGRVTPYMIYLDHDNADIILAVRGLNLAKESDYAVLLDNKLGQTKFGGGGGSIADIGGSSESGYADIISSVVLQDDFLPRTTTALEDVFKSLIWLGRFPPVVRTAVPVDGRFDHMVLSCNATSDHALIWVERESQRALDLMREKDKIMAIPIKQRMKRQESLAREHSQEYKAALQRAIALDIPEAFSPHTYGTFHEMEGGENSGKSNEEILSSDRRRESWDGFVERLFDEDDSGHMVFKKS